MSIKPLGIDFGIKQPLTSSNSDDATLVPVTLSNQHAGTAVEARAILRSVGFSETDLNSEQGKKLLSEVEVGLRRSRSNYNAGELVYDSVNKRKVWQAYIKVSNQNLEHFKGVLAEIRDGDRNAQIDTTAGPQGKLEQMRADAAMRSQAIQGGELGTVNVVASAAAIPLEFPGSLPTMTLPSAVEMASAVAETAPPVALMSSALAAPAITAAHYAEKYAEMQQAAVLQQADAAYRALEVQDLANLPPFGNNQPLPPPVLPVTPDQNEQGRKLSAPLTTPAAPPNVVTSTPPMSNPQPLPPPPPFVNPIQQQSGQDLIYAASMSKQLADNMAAAGMGVRPEGYAAHHIVAWDASRAEEARRVLTSFGIDVNSALNGVYLPATEEAAKTTSAMYHRSLHTNPYYEEVNRRLETATTGAQVIEILEQISTDLKKGTFPK